MICLYIYTAHAIEKMDAYGFEKGEIEAVLRKGVKWKEDGRDMWHSNSGGVEVVFTQQDGSIIIITVYEARWKK